MKVSVWGSSGMWQRLAMQSIVAKRVKKEAENEGVVGHEWSCESGWMYHIAVTHARLACTLSMMQGLGSTLTPRYSGCEKERFGCL